MNSREATFDGVKVVVELKAIPIPMPNTSTPAKMAIVEMLNKDGCEAEDLEVVADLPVDLRLIEIYGMRETQCL
ncbi:hypothetical protein BDGGKGIB_02621 [Nodularia sphaerocarpa UHCC 0038]|nr:hypothetical protein BDGGKGIB_02621 [Nodularia sphaerocarpa UHCC 0038]